MRALVVLNLFFFGNVSLWGGGELGQSVNCCLTFSFFFSFFPAKSLPLHCVVESVSSLQSSIHQDSRNPWKRRSNTETDSYVIIPAITPFCEIVNTAMQRLGYSHDVANTARGKSSRVEDPVHWVH
jgi:Ubiquitin-like oligomerisation domain of SATB